MFAQLIAIAIANALVIVIVIVIAILKGHHQILLH
jgi:hypothetical protein